VSAGASAGTGSGRAASSARARSCGRRADRGEPHHDEGSIETQTSRFERSARQAAIECGAESGSGRGATPTAGRDSNAEVQRAAGSIHAEHGAARTHRAAAAGAAEAVGAAAAEDG